MMRYLLMVTMVFILSRSTYLIPEYQWGTTTLRIMAYNMHLNSHVPGSQTMNVVFPRAFSTTPPQIIAFWTSLDTVSGTNQYQTRCSSITKNGFTIRLDTNQIIASLPVQWLAFVDNDLYVLQTVFQAMNFSGSLTIPVPYSLPYIPVAAVFLTGIGYETQTATPYNQQYRLYINQITTTYIELIATTTVMTSINGLSYSLIYGLSRNLITSQTLFSSLMVSTQYYTQGSGEILSFVGLTGINCFNNIRIFIASNFKGLIATSTYGDTSIYQVSVSYFSYKPCAYFCSACNNNPPHCDSCLPSDNRQGLDCTSCMSNTFSTNPLSSCQSCLSYCDQCSGSASQCVSCLLSTGRLNPTDCTTCPSQMFILAGVDNCQQCAPYCDNCSSSAIHCLACQTSTFRTIPPNCQTCTTQYYLVLNQDSCQPCQGYCNECITSSTNCILCNLTTLRTIPPNCTTCPTLMFAQSGFISCQQCRPYCGECTISDNNCTTCLASTFRINPPNCSQCQSQYYLVQNVTNCQGIQYLYDKACADFCNECTTTNNCIACQNNSMRTIPPNCTTCPAQYYVVSNIVVCQRCMSYCNNCQNYTGLCVACSSQSLRLNPPNCLTCPQYTYFHDQTCIQCDTSCQTCNSRGCLSCKYISQYVNYQSLCVDCPQHCLSCDANYCYTCLEPCAQCNMTQCLQCVSDNYYIDGTKCVRCPDNCQTCDSLTCLTCLGPRIVMSGVCICQSPCLTCNQTQCLTCISEDYRIQQGKCQFCPKTCVACDVNGNCISGPINCKQVYLSGKDVECKQCQSNYYLQSPYQCIRCQQECLECDNYPNNCTICRFTFNDKSECQICENFSGYYSNYNTNTCYTICGDGITVGNEQCDDGNSILHDGCDNCQIAQGYTCIGLVCQEIIYPIPILEQITNLDSAYNRTKVFSLNYNTPINALNNISIEIKIDPNLNFTYTLTQINNQQFQIVLNLMDQSVDSILHLKFINITQILSLSGQSQQIVNLSCQISNYVMNTMVDQDISDSTNQITSILLIILIIMTCIAILLGGLEIFWNLLDLLQTISYLKYINTVKPQFLQSFFDLFGFLQFQNLPLSRLLSTQDFVQNYVDVNNFNMPPPLISNDGYSSSTIINIIPILNVLVTSIIFYYQSQILLFCLIRVDLTKFTSSIKLKIMIYDLKQNLLKACDNINKQWIWSGLSRIYISSSYEICFTIALGIQGLQLNTVVTEVDFSFTLLLVILHLAITSSFTNIIRFQNNTLIYYNNQYGAIYEGLKFKLFAKYYNILLIHKKFIFMIFLVLLYNDPIFQIMAIISIQLTQILVLLIFNPLSNETEKYKQIFSEFLMLFAEFQLAILVIDDYHQLFIYNNRKIFGWICVIQLCMIIICQLIFDSYQQIKKYYRKYRVFKKFVDSFQFTQKALSKNKHKYVENFVI